MKFLPVMSMHLHPPWIDHDVGCHICGYDRLSDDRIVGILDLFQHRLGSTVPQSAAKDRFPVWDRSEPMVLVSPQYTTQTCSSCGYMRKGGEHLTLKDREWICPQCGTFHHRDTNADRFIMDIAALYNADVIVFEHLDRAGKKRGSKKQRLHLWRSQYVQSMVTEKAHRLGIRISRICAWGTSRLAYDGSGRVLRGKEARLSTYSLCRFQNGKIYHCDLSASYNIGSRYFIREILKSLPERERLALEAKVPQTAKRSTCTWSTLINLNAELMSLEA